MEGSNQDFVSVGPGSLAGRYLRMFWQPVYLSENLRPGRPVPIHVMAEDFTLYRGESGTPYLVGPRCPHRGLTLAAGRVVAENIECLSSFNSMLSTMRFVPNGLPHRTQSNGSASFSTTAVLACTVVNRRG